MKILIKQSNKEKISKILDRVQEKSRVRTISVDNLFNETENCLKILNRKNIPKNARCLFRIYVDYNAQKFANAYKYEPIATIFRIEFNKIGHPFINDIKRDTCSEEVFNHCYLDRDKIANVLMDSFLITNY